MRINSKHGPGLAGSLIVGAFAPAIFFYATTGCLAQSEHSPHSQKALSSANLVGSAMVEPRGEPQPLSEPSKAPATRPSSNQDPAPSLNPIRWLFGPVIKLEEQTVRLQEQIIALTGPLAAVKPLIVGLHGQVEATQKRLNEVNTHLDAVHGQLDSLSSKMTTIDKSIDATNRHMNSCRGTLALGAGPYGQCGEIN
jgi:hypothetical protein